MKEKNEDLKEESMSVEASESQDDGLENAPIEECAAIVEALIFAHGELLPSKRIQEVTKITEEKLGEAIKSIQERYESTGSSLMLVKIGSKFQFRTREQYATYLAALKAGRPKRLSPAALETLAVVAYRQPVVKSDIEKIRGVDATPTLKTLIERKILKIVGYQATVGQPALYGTTDHFMSLFGLESLRELPALRELKELDEDPGEPGEVFEQDEKLEAEVRNISESPRDYDLESEDEDHQYVASMS